MRLVNLLALGMGLILCQGLHAQEQWGLRLGSSAGVNGLALNPASGNGFQYQFDVNLVSGHAFLETNYAWLRRSSILGLYSKLDIRSLSDIDSTTLELVEGTDYDKEPGAYSKDAVVFDFADDSRDRFLFASAMVTGPSALFHLKGGHSFGWVLQGRHAMGGQGVPNSLSYLRYDRQPDLEPFSVHSWKMGMVTWAEIGLHYGRQWETYSGMFQAGITAKYLMGFEGFYFQNATDLEAYTKITGDTIAAEKMDLRYNYTSSNLGAPPLELKRNGSGFAADLGVEWTWEGEYEPYQAKLGISLLDIGAIYFNRNAAKHHSVSPDPVVLPNGDYDFVESLEDLDKVVRLFSYQTLGDSMASFVSNHYTLWLPSALSLQGEYAFYPGLWVHAAVVQRIPNPGASIERGNALMVAPRFEKRWFSAGLPVTLYNWKFLRVGAFVRLGPLVLGSDHFPAFFLPGRLHGGDFYFALHWPFNFEGRSRAGQGGKGSYPKLKRGEVKCYHFN